MDPVLDQLYVTRSLTYYFYFLVWESAVTVKKVDLEIFKDSHVLAPQVMKTGVCNSICLYLRMEERGPRELRNGLTDFIHIRHLRIYLS